MDESADEPGSRNPGDLLQACQNGNLSANLRGQLGCFKKRPFVLGPSCPTRKIHVVEVVAEVGSFEAPPLTALVGVAAVDFGTSGAHLSLVPRDGGIQALQFLGNQPALGVQKCARASAARLGSFFE